MGSKTGIVLFVYKRPYHTKEVLKGLKKNNISKLYIFSDGPKKDENDVKVKQVRSLIAKIDWCETEIHINPGNKGLANSIIDGVNYILSKHERVIVLEDDCVPSGDFISFMEKCFNKYENTERVMSISAYTFPIKIPEDYKYDTYLSYRHCSYGWGTWRRDWKYFNRNEDFLLLTKESPRFRKKVIRAGENLIPMLESHHRGKIDSWSIFWSLSIIKKDGLCILPVKSRIKNIGFDGSGIHCRKCRIFDVELSDHYNGSVSFPENIELNVEIIKEITRFHSYSFKEKSNKKIKTLLKTIRLYKPLKSIKDKIIDKRYESSTY
jgi:hypothetical protein